MELGKILRTRNSNLRLETQKEFMQKFPLIALKKKKNAKPNRVS